MGAISFSKTVSPQFGLGEYDGREDMLNKIEQISYEGLGTNTAEALNYLYEKVGYVTTQNVTTTQNVINFAS